MVKALFDTNIIIDYLNGEPKAFEEISLYENIYISIITYIEVLVGTSHSENIDMIKDYLLSLNIVHIDMDISNTAISIRKKYKVKIPDALILASAQKVGMILVTRNTKDFDTNIPLVRVPYTL
jgi:predicted nucleic acid-binding protein